MEEKLKLKILSIIEDVQEAQIQAGGRFLRQQEIQDMKFGDLIRLLVPNKVEFNIKYTGEFINKQI